MSLCTKLIAYKQNPCVGVSGGIAQIFIFDNADFDFTQIAPVSGVPQSYDAITDLSAGAGKLYGVKFQRNEAEYTFDQSSKGGYFTLYEHKMMFSAPDLSMLTMQWNYLVDKAGECCGIGVVIVMNSGRIFIMGEGSVNTNPLAIPFYCYQDGSKGSSGKKFDDPNTNNVTLKGDYNRSLIEYTGGIASLLPFAA